MGNTRLLPPAFHSSQGFGHVVLAGRRSTSQLALDISTSIRAIQIIQSDMFPRRTGPNGLC